MKRAICLLFALGLATSAAAETKMRYLVGTRRPVRAAELRMLRDSNEVADRQVRTYANFDLFGVDLTAQEAAELRRSGAVRHVNPVIPVSILSDDRPILTPTVSERLAKQVIPYGIDSIRARDVWAAGRGAAGGINVAVVDTGIDYNHPDLKPRYAGGYNVMDPKKTDDPFDDHGHGTHVAGTVAAMDNDFGVVGVAPEARIWSVKVLNSEGNGTDETLVAGLDWLISKKREIGGNWIANFSLGAQSGTDASQQAFRRAMDEGFIIVAAAGNNSAYRISFPAVEQGALAIAAIDNKDNVAEFSNRGRGIAFVAPGVQVLSTVPVGTVDATDVAIGNETIEAVPLIGTGKGFVTAGTVLCGYGAPEDFPGTGIEGKIALIRRSPPVPVTVVPCSIPNTCFRDKVRNAVARGASAVVFLPDERGLENIFTINVGEEKPAPAGFPVVIVRTKTIAERLIAVAGNLPLTVNTRGEDYTYLSGTSMATPHVVGAIALAWSLAPNATAEQVKIAVKLTAHDLGEPGYDKEFGYGRIDALAAAHYLAPGLFGVPPPTPLPPRRRPGA
jgi:serine protease